MNAATPLGALCNVPCQGERGYDDAWSMTMAWRAFGNNTALHAAPTDLAPNLPPNLPQTRASNPAPNFAQNWEPGNNLASGRHTTHIHEHGHDLQATPSPAHDAGRAVESGVGRSLSASARARKRFAAGDGRPLPSAAAAAASAALILLPPRGAHVAGESDANYTSKWRNTWIENGLFPI